MTNFFFSTISTLQAFEGFTGDKRELIGLLEKENVHKEHNEKSYLTSNNRDAVNLETAKGKETDNNESISKDGNMSLKMKDNSSIIKGPNSEYDVEGIKGKKQCKC